MQRRKEKSRAAPGRKTTLESTSFTRVIGLLRPDDFIPEKLDPGSTCIPALAGMSSS
jgi:hypothetical protein